MADDKQVSTTDEDINTGTKTKATESQPSAQVISIATKKPMASADTICALKDAVKELSEIRQAVFNLAVQLALAGPLAEWAEAEPVGAIWHFDEGQLLETKDPGVAVCIEAWHAMRKARRALKALSVQASGR